MKVSDRMELGRPGATISRRHFVLGAATLALLAGCGTSRSASGSAAVAKASPETAPQASAGVTPETAARATAKFEGANAATPSSLGGSTSEFGITGEAAPIAPAEAVAPGAVSDAAGSAAAAVPNAVAPATSASLGTFEVSHSEEQWRALLSPEQYSVLRNDGTEKPYSSPLNGQREAGIFSCAGCALDAFSSTTKFESGTGWPSFWQAMGNSVLELSDTTFAMVRTKVQCRKCGSHLGHVFDDGPDPTGLRYCLNGVALNFRPAS